MKKLYTLIAAIMIFCAAKASDDTLSTDRTNGVFGFPVAYTSPETSFAFGVAGLYTFYLNEEDQSHPSRISPFAIYTLRNQLLLSLPFEVWLNDNQYQIPGELGYFKFIYKFHGVGNFDDHEYEESYSTNFFRIRLDAMKLVRNNLYAGFRYWNDRYVFTEVMAGGLIDNREVVGSMAGATSAPGIIVKYDSRDNVFYPTKGWQASTSVQYADSWTGSSYNYLKWNVDVARYLSTPWDDVVALNLVGQSSGGDVPFFDMGMFGGSRKLRGYFEGRYRDKNMALFQAEYRGKIYKRFGYAVFGGAGTVASNWSEIQASHMKVAGGAGIRFLFDRKKHINLRADYAIGENGQSGFYATISEAF